MARHFKQRAQVKLNNMERMKKFFDDEASFEALMHRVIEKHGERWADTCHSRGVEPHPWNVMYAIFDIAEDEGEEAPPVDSFTSSFPSMLWKYLGWTFAITHGQGSVASIYRGEELAYRD